MRLIATADLHYNIARSVEPTRRIADEICGLHADALLILGDAGGRDVGIVRDCLRLFDRFRGGRFFVAGNHDLWTGDDEDALTRLERTLPAICREAGFHPLDIEPAVIDGVGLVGSIGWYDHSYRPAWLNIPLRFYEAKIAPGAAARLAGYEHLDVEASDVPDEARQIGTRWMDGQHVRLPMSDLEFCHYLIERLERHLADVSARCERVVVGMHHLPFWKMVPQARKATWAFASSFMGSELFGDALLNWPKVSHVLCGHSHRALRVQCGHITCIDVGSTYIQKRLEVLDV
jgi:hypothetical protein